MWGNVFTMRNNILAVCEILNRVSDSEGLPEKVERRVYLRSLLLSQLSNTPHRYTVSECAFIYLTINTMSVTRYRRLLTSKTLVSYELTYELTH